jgi:hypothetical protein
VNIGIKTCKDPSFVLIYGLCGVENCTEVSIETVHEAFEERKLLTTKYCKLMVGMEVLWPLKDVSLNDELVVTMLD